jgi:2-amino-4-hydroxy-6-hydroxymethyldihydropteridine diphosphokinase
MSSGWRIDTAAHESGSTVWLGLGANEGDRRANLVSALDAIAGFGRIEAVSSVYESEPVGWKDQPDFWNLVVRIHTSFPPRALLDAIKTIEAGIGRREGIRWGPRPIDIDILLYGDRNDHEDGLEVPHPRMMERGFVLYPLVEIDPDLVHPVSGQRLADALREGRFERVRRLFAGTDLQGPVRS